MFIKFINKTHASYKNAKSYQLQLFFIALVCALTIHPARAHAQIIGEHRVDIPFQFYAGNAKLPAGEYVVRMLDNSNLRVMEIRAADGSTSALFGVEDAQVNSAPPESELIFNKYGNRYFLAELFDEGNPDGSRVPESSLEKRISKKVAEAQEHVPANDQGQHGD